MTKKNYWTVQQIAEIFQVQGHTVREWLREGEKFPNAFKMGGTDKGRWRIPDEDVRAFVNKEYGTNV